ncbi:MAG: hypothetical protein LOY02_14470, partial [Intrasporangium sp.]|nr:hypothetical protein [Intrasporangium sp.]
MPHPTTDPAPPATARQGTARQGSDPAGPWEDRWDPERGGGFAWQWDPAELARFEQWHEQTLARQLAQAAALPDPFEPFEPAFPLERDDLLEPTGPSGAAGPSGADGPDGDGSTGLGPSLQDA